MDTEFCEFANALLALRMGKSAGKPTYPSISYSAVSLLSKLFEPYRMLCNRLYPFSCLQDDNDSTVCEEEDLFNSKMSANIVPFPSLSWGKSQAVGISSRRPHPHNLCSIFSLYFQLRKISHRLMDL